MHGYVPVDTNCAVFSNIYKSIMGRYCSDDDGGPTYKLTLCQYSDAGQLELQVEAYILYFRR